MLLLSKARIHIDRRGGVRVEGLLEPYAVRIRQFVAELGLRDATIRYRFGRYVFSRGLDPAVCQRLRNFLHNECPLRQ